MATSKASKIAKTSQSAKKASGAKKTNTKKSDAKKSEDNYTDPKLRERLKKKILAGDKGGDPGEWSARKSQILTREYKKAGGGYKNSKRTESQKNLEHWTKEEWTTSDGGPSKREGGKVRYLPKAAWDKLSPAQKAAANRSKKKGDRAGKQFVANPESVRKARGQSQKRSRKKPDAGRNSLST